MKSARILIAGAGAIARAHSAAARLLPCKVEIHAADPIAASREGFAKAAPEAVLHESAEAMLALPVEEEDIVIVATPPFLHAPLTRVALESGRNVLSEKPLGISIEEVEPLFAMAAERGLLLGCCSSRFLGIPSTERAKELLVQGAIGEVQTMLWQICGQRSRPGVEFQAGSRWFIDRAKSGGGSLNDWGVYDFATILDLLDPVSGEILSAWIGRTHTGNDPKDVPYTVEDRVVASIRFQTRFGPVLLTYERAGASHGPKRFCTELQGADGAISWDWLTGDSSAKVRLHHDESGQPATREEPLPAAEIADCHHRPLIYFWRELHGEPNRGLTGAKALRNFRYVRGIYTAAETGTAVRIA